MNKEEYDKVIAFCTRCQKPIFTEENLNIHRACIGQINTVLMKDESNAWWQRIKREALKVE